MRFAGSMSSDFDRAEAQRQKEISSRIKKEERARRRAQFRERVFRKIRQTFKFLAIVTFFTLAFTYRAELQEFMSLACNQIMGGQGHSGSQGTPRNNGLTHQDEINQASQ